MLKKSFCDGWDNLFTLVAVNVVFMTIGLGLAMLTTVMPQNELILALFFLAGCVILSIAVFAFGDMAAVIADFGASKTLDYFKKIPSVLKDASLFGLMIGVIGLLSYVGVPFYFRQGTYLGIIMGGVFLWLDIFALAIFQWFLPIRSIMHNDFKKCLKKSFIIFLDNTGFSFAMLFHNLILLVLSILCVGIIPSAAGMLLANTEALRLRLYKYDYLEEHPELKTKRERRQIPWEELIFEDRETLGPRKLRSFLFPWKE